jgi:alpha-galactosidase
MRKKVKIVIIGAGSAMFGFSCIRDAFTTKELFGSELVFVDLDQVALDRMLKAAHRINQELNANYQISGTTDRYAAFPGADYVIVSIAVNRLALWKEDFNVPKKYGIKHVLGENGGPGAVFHTMRNIPIILDICKDIERLCPEALLINFTNPESRICLAIHKYTKVKAVGLCHQIGEGIRIIAKIMGKKPEELDVKAFGLNHFTWFKDIREKGVGVDLYPLLQEREKTFDLEYEKLSRFMFRQFGMFPTSGDGHLGEFLPYAHEMMSTAGYDFDANERYREANIKFIEGIGAGSIALDTVFEFPEKGGFTTLTPSGEKAFAIIKGITFNTNEVIESANIPNDGYITNLPHDAIVEVPAVVSGNGVNGLGMGELPRGIAALCQSQINIQHLTVDAGVRGDREAAIQALLVDPNVPSAAAALQVYETIMAIDQPYLPQFK